MKNINSRLGKRTIKILESNPKIISSIKKLEKICDEQSSFEKYSKSDYNKKGSARKMILEWAYVGCILSSLNQGGNHASRLKNYVTNIKTTLEHNRYSDPAFYVPEIFNAYFK